MSLLWLLLQLAIAAISTANAIKGRSSLEPGGGGGGVDDWTLHPALQSRLRELLGLCVAAWPPPPTNASADPVNGTGHWTPPLARLALEETTNSSGSGVNAEDGDAAGGGRRTSGKEDLFTVGPLGICPPIGKGPTGREITDFGGKRKQNGLPRPSSNRDEGGSRRHDARGYRSSRLSVSGEAARNLGGDGSIAIAATSGPPGGRLLSDAEQLPSGRPEASSSPKASGYRQGDFRSALYGWGSSGERSGDGRWNGDFEYAGTFGANGENIDTGYRGDRAGGGYTGLRDSSGGYAGSNDRGMGGYRGINGDMDNSRRGIYGGEFMNGGSGGNGGFGTGNSDMGGNPGNGGSNSDGFSFSNAGASDGRDGNRNGYGGYNGGEGGGDSSGGAYPSGGFGGYDSDSGSQSNGGNRGSNDFGINTGSQWDRGNNNRGSNSDQGRSSMNRNSEGYGDRNSRNDRNGKRGSGRRHNDDEDDYEDDSSDSSEEDYDDDRDSNSKGGGRSSGRRGGSGNRRGGSGGGNSRRGDRHQARVTRHNQDWRDGRGLLMATNPDAAQDNEAYEEADSAQLNQQRPPRNPRSAAGYWTRPPCAAQCALSRLGVVDGEGLPCEDAVRRVLRSIVGDQAGAEAARSVSRCLLRLNAAVSEDPCDVSDKLLECLLIDVDMLLRDPEAEATTMLSLSL